MKKFKKEAITLIVKRPGELPVIYKNGEYLRRERILENDNREFDFYETPYKITEALAKKNIFPKEAVIYDPCFGKGAIEHILQKYGYNNIIKDDLCITGKNFLYCRNKYDYLIFNPPFNKFDEFIFKAQKITKKMFASIVKTDYFSTITRSRNGVWKHLKYFFTCNKKLDYREDPNTTQTGFYATGWGIWDMSWQENYWMDSILDVT
jgi:hypothetical protein